MKKKQKEEMAGGGGTGDWRGGLPFPQADGMFVGCHDCPSVDWTRTLMKCPESATNPAPRCCFLKSHARNSGGDRGWPLHDCQQGCGLQIDTPGDYCDWIASRMCNTRLGRRTL